MPEWVQKASGQTWRDKMLSDIKHKKVIFGSESPWAAHH